MKKLLVILVILLVSITCATAQDWQLDVDFTQHLMNRLETGFEVEQTSRNTIIFFDHATISSTEIIGRLSYLLRTLETIMRQLDYDFQQLSNYQYIGYVNRNNTDLQIVIPGPWIVNYYKIRNSDARHDVLIELFYDQYQSFQMEQRSINPMQNYR